MQQPSIGRVVHYQSYGTPGGEYPSVPRAAIITDIVETEGVVAPVVSLAVLNPTGLFFDRLVMYSETPTPGHWSWPPRV